MSSKVTGPNSNKRFIDSIDTDSPDYARDRMRPVDVKQDVRQMAERRRVEEVLKSRSFREQLEEIVVDKIKISSPNRASVVALKQLSDLLLPQQARLRHGPIYGLDEVMKMPINDLSSLATPVDRQQRVLRCRLACAYRLIDMYKWTQFPSSSTISARLNKNEFLMAAYSEDISDFSKMSAKRLVVQSDKDGSSKAGIHSAVYKIRQKAESVFYLRSPSVVLFSSMDIGLLPLSRDTMAVGHVDICDLGDMEDGGYLGNLEEALGNSHKVVILKDKGALIVGDSIDDAFMTARRLISAVDIQIKTVTSGLENVHLASEEVQRRIFETGLKKQPKKDELEFEALIRHLENTGHCTGLSGNAPVFRKVEKADRVNAEVELPPTNVSMAYMEDGDVVKSLLLDKKGGWAEWLNSPNAYKREEVEQGGGTPYKKKITKWIQEKEAPGTIFKIDSPNQFVPVGSDPKELKQKVREIRREYYDEKITAGPQSKILEGVTWEEAQKIKEGNVASDTVILVGAASRGIIQKKHRAEGAVFKTYYAPNPFDDTMNEEEVEAYKYEISMKEENGKGGEREEGLPSVISDHETVPMDAGPEGHLVSTEERLHQVKLQQHPNGIAGDGQWSAPTGGWVGATSNSVMEGHCPILGSPTKSSSSAEFTDGATGGVAGLEMTPATGYVVESYKNGATTTLDISSTSPTATLEKKKKKKGFKLPSFSSKKK